MKEEPCQKNKKRRTPIRNFLQDWNYSGGPEGIWKLLIRVQPQLWDIIISSKFHHTSPSANRGMKSHITFHLHGNIFRNEVVMDFCIAMLFLVPCTLFLTQRKFYGTKKKRFTADALFFVCMCQLDFRPSNKLSTIIAKKLMFLPNAAVFKWCKFCHQKCVFGTVQPEQSLQNNWHGIKYQNKHSFKVVSSSLTFSCHKFQK